MRRRLFLVSIAVAGLAAAGCTGGDPAGRTRAIDLGPMRIDRIYRSMDGPFDRTRFDISDIDWVTGFRTEVYDVSTGERLGDEFICHSQLQVDNETRLLVTATGIPAIDFPDGYAMPLQQILSGIPEAYRGVSLLGMVLNNHEPEIDRLTKLRIHVDYLRSSDLENPDQMKKLYKVGLPITVQTDPGAGHPHGPGHDHDADSCAEHPPGQTGEMVGTHSAHWMVSPGEDRRSNIYESIVPVEATVHFGVVHLHNHGIWMRLTDLTAGEVLWQTDVEYEPERLQIARIPAFRSTAGFRLRPDHRYEVEAFYDNSSDRPVDAMASMYLFYHPEGNQDISYPEPPPGSALERRDP